VRREIRALTALAGLTGVLLLAAAGTASAVVGQPLVRYVSLAGDSTYLHWTTTDPSQPTPDYAQPEIAFGYTVPALPGTVPVLSCTWTSDGQVRQYLSVDPAGCGENGGVAATVEANGLPAPTITTVAVEGSFYVTPPEGAVDVTAVYRCVSRDAYLITPSAPIGSSCGEGGAFYDADRLLGYAATVPVAAPPADLPEVPAAALLPLAALGVLTGGTVLARRRGRRAA
jgi:hypothetical protein